MSMNPTVVRRLEGVPGGGGTYSRGGDGERARLDGGLLGS